MPEQAGSEQPEDLPLGFDIIMRSEIWPHGEGPVHNYEDPCPSAPDSGARTDLHTVPGDGKRLCRYCEWPSNAEQALNFDDSLRADGGQPASGSDQLECEVCEEPLTEELSTLTDDGHPLGPNLVVCGRCDDYRADDCWISGCEEAPAEAQVVSNGRGSFGAQALCEGHADENGWETLWQYEDKQSGLYEKYEVRKDGEVVEDCFVLEPKNDRAARLALHAYANHTDDDQLATDLTEWAASIQEQAHADQAGDRDD